MNTFMHNAEQDGVYFNIATLLYHKAGVQLMVPTNGSSVAFR